MRLVDVGTAEDPWVLGVLQSPDVNYGGPDGTIRWFYQLSSLLEERFPAAELPPIKQLPGYRVRRLSDACTESGAQRREHAVPDEIENAGSSEVRRDRGKTVLLMGRS